MTPEAAALLASFLIQAAPLLGGATIGFLQLLIDQIPGPEYDKCEFAAMCQRQITRVWLEYASAPFTDQYRRELAHDAIVVSARDMGAELPADLFKTLALS